MSKKQEDRRNVNKYEQLQIKWSYLIFSPQRFSILKFFLLRAYLLYLLLPIVRFDYTTRPLRKHDVMKVSRIEYLTLELLSSSLWNIYHISGAPVARRVVAVVLPSTDCWRRDIRARHLTHSSYLRAPCILLVSCFLPSHRLQGGSEKVSCSSSSSSDIFRVA